MTGTLTGARGQHEREAGKEAPSRREDGYWYTHWYSGGATEEFIHVGIPTSRVGHGNNGTGTYYADLFVMMDDEAVPCGQRNETRNEIFAPISSIRFSNETGTPVSWKGTPSTKRNPL